MTRPISDITRLTELQAGMLFHAVEHPGAPDPYLVRFAVDLDGPTDPERWRRALAALVDRHSVLRSAFLHEGLDEPVAVVRTSAEPPWTVRDLTGEPDPRAASAAHDDADMARGLAPDRELPLRAELHLLTGATARLVLTLHHLVVDGWSVPILLEELVRLHAADGRDAGLPPSTPFSRYLEWLDTQDQPSALAAWGEVMAGVEPLRLSGGGAPSRRPHRIEITLDEDLSAGLSSLAARSGATQASVIGLAWGLALARATGRRDAVFGLTGSGRPAELDGAERAVGLFVTTLPVRVPTDPWARVGDVLADMTATRSRLLEHQHVGLGALQRHLGRGPLFDTTLVVENLPGHTDGAVDAGGGVAVTNVDSRDSTHYPVTVVAVPGPRLRVRLDHHPDLLDEADAARLGTLLDGALRALATAGPDRTLGRLPLVDQGGRAHVHGLGVGPPAAVPRRTLAELLADAAATHAGEIAVIGPDGTRTDYRELHARAGALSHRLLDHGAGPDAVVGIALPRSLELMVGLVAIQLAGAAYLPLDPDAPPARRDQLLADAGPCALLVPGPDGDVEVREVREGQVVRRDGAPGPDPVHHHPGDHRPVDAHGHDLAYVIYTSGSTGAPKGVEVGHDAIVNRLAWMQDAFPLRAGEAVLHKTPTTFDVSVWELFWPLLHGATVVLAAPGEHRDPVALAARIIEHAVGTVHFVPTVLDAFLGALDTTTAAGVECVLSRIVCSGEGLSPAVRDRAHRLLPTVALHNLYGPTEAAVDVTAVELRGAAGDVPIGRPVWNTGLRVLDPTLAELPPGTVGELHLTGVQLARGYRGRPALTAERFVADPAGPPGSRMYRTGDLARWGDDGELRHVGRVDDQVKIRGQRVEPGEVEAVLADLPGVSAAAVLALPDAAGAPRLVAYVVRGAGADDPQRLLAVLAERLPEALVPSAVIELDALPVGAHGKLDRTALPSPSTAAGERSRGARNVTEATVCAVFARTLGVARVGADDDFVALGGHSLLMMRVASELSRALGREIGVPTLLAAPTPAALAARLAAPEAPDASPLDPLLALRAGGAGTPLFCVHPAAGLSWCYLGLLGTLDPRVPVWALQAPDLTVTSDRPGPGEPPGIVARAADFVARLRTVRPQGPYRLLGWSVGGRIAHEMAIQLRAAGETVELLAVLDAYPHTVLDSARPEAVLADAGLADGVPGPQRVRDELGDPEWLDDDTAARILETYAATTGALVGEVPGVLDGSMLLFVAERDDTADYHPEQWRDHVTGDLTCVHLPHRHADLGEPDAMAEVAARINRVLAEPAS